MTNQISLITSTTWSLLIIDWSFEWKSLNITFCSEKYISYMSVIMFIKIHDSTLNKKKAFWYHKIGLSRKRYIVVSLVSHFWKKKLFLSFIEEMHQNIIQLFNIEKDYNSFNLVISSKKEKRIETNWQNLLSDFGSLLKCQE